MTPMDVLALRDLDLRHVARKVPRLLEQLREGDFRSAEVRKLRGAPLYRARLDEKDRLLFQLGEHDGRTHVLLLEVVRNHEYDKARFLNGGSFTDDDFEPLSSLTPESQERERLRYVNPASPALHFLDKPLSFDDAQNAVFDTPLPLIVIGSAGSGKTALTLEKLKTLPGHGLYLTRSSYLVDSARALYFASGDSNDGQEVDFLSLSELIETIDVPAGRAARYADFAAWYQRMRGVFKLKEPHKIFEEITGVLTGTSIAGPWLTEEEYLGLGVRQSIFLGEERAVVHQVFLRWMAHMKETGLFDPGIAAWERREAAAEVYDFLVVDEVQDITTVELRLALATLREKRHFLLCGDSNQIVHPNLFSWARVKSLFHGDAPRGAATLERIHILSANYRNTQAVTALANRLLLVKQRRFGSIDRESNYLVQCVSGDRGRVDLVADDAAVRAEIDEKTHRSTRTAIVVLRDEDKADARAAFRTPLVFSVQEAKGLEYEHVVLFNLVSGAAAEFRECADGVLPSDAEGGLSYARARDKTDKSLDAYKFYVNALYVAITRAVKTLLCVERDTSHALWVLLAVHRMNEPVELARDESSREEWQREARKLELQGKTEQAEQIRREILETQPVPWPILDEGTFEAVTARALGPGVRDKAAQQLLFEYAITCDAPDIAPQLVDAGFRHARNPESGRAYIEQTHYADYHLRAPKVLPTLLRRHGVDFRNPLNETPLMVAARLGRADLVRDLLSQGADPELTDTAGRDALRVAIAAWRWGKGLKRQAFEEVFLQLAGTPLKTRVGARMTKLDPRSMEWFLLNLLPAVYRQALPGALRDDVVPTLQAVAIEDAVASLPPRVLLERRRRRPYINSVLAKNELYGTNPYNRRLFLRIDRGYYILNPVLEVERKGEWVDVHEWIGLPLLLRSLAPATPVAGFERWLSQVRTRLASHLPPHAGAAPTSEGP